MGHACSECNNQSQTSDVKASAREQEESRGIASVRGSARPLHDRVICLSSRHDEEEGKYEGERLHGVPHGRGTWSALVPREDGTATHYVYSGNWESGLQHGEGKEFWGDGSTFEGQFQYGRKNGRGSFVGDHSYHGQFEDNCMHGVGTFTWADGRLFRGHFAEGQMSGHGTMEWPDGRVYDGQFDDNLRHGTGQLRWPDGRVYEGQWRAGRQDGVGLCTKPGLSGFTDRVSHWRIGHLIQLDTDTI
mmetsp:Transcript_78736/g.210209  ORF Transcript_78736/g.210209 Transcript_78736/m.210209 type:complete len:246 (-) Transcript_78736:151-888(-)